MKNILLIALIATICVGCAQAASETQTTDSGNDPQKEQTSTESSKADMGPVDHSQWDKLLKKYVNDKGLVNYKGFMKDSVAFNEYLDNLSVNPPQKDKWTDEDQLAYWFNAYNAYTIKLILMNYPVKSIKDIAGGIPFVNTPWDVKFIKIGDETLDLNNIEHGTIRKEFDDERIHYALVCAAVSCPRLRNEAYQPDKLNAQLEDQAKTFFNDPTKNKISEEEAKISPILDWYGKDFKDKAPNLRTYVNQYSKIKINDGVKVGFTDYDWALNEQK